MNRTSKMIAVFLRAFNLVTGEAIRKGVGVLGMVMLLAGVLVFPLQHVQSQDIITIHQFGTSGLIMPKRWLLMMMATSTSLGTRKGPCLASQVQEAVMPLSASMTPVATSSGPASSAPRRLMRCSICL